MYEESDINDQGNNNVHINENMFINMDFTESEVKEVVKTLNTRR